MMLRNILLTIQYDGSAFEGSQRQKDKRTVFGTLEKALERLVKHPVRLIPAGRTDAGVHAECQLANFLTVSSIAGDSFRYHLVPELPDDLAVSDSADVPMSFHSRFAAVEKTYRYELSRKKFLHPVLRKYKGQCTYPLDLKKMERLIRLFEGEHDFSAFSLVRPGQNPIRELRSFSMEVLKDELHFHLCAPSFLNHQVRILVGTLLDVGRGRLSEELVLALLENGDTHTHAPAAFAGGLYLEAIRFDLT